MRGHHTADRAAEGCAVIGGNAGRQLRVASSVSWLLVIASDGP